MANNSLFFDLEDDEHYDNNSFLNQLPLDISSESEMSANFHFFINGGSDHPTNEVSMNFVSEGIHYQNIIDNAVDFQAETCADIDEETKQFFQIENIYKIVESLIISERVDPVLNSINFAAPATRSMIENLPKQRKKMVPLKINKKIKALKSKYCQQQLLQELTVGEIKTLVACSISNFKQLSLENIRRIIDLRDEIFEAKQIVEKHLNIITGNQQNEDNEARICKVCWEKFGTGRQLGGHMSKKHPGFSNEYRNKKLLKKSRLIDKYRREYFQKLNALGKKKVVIESEEELSFE